MNYQLILPDKDARPSRYCPHCNRLGLRQLSGNMYECDYCGAVVQATIGGKKHDVQKQCLRA